MNPTKASEELDSYMYQTVGQDAIELVAAALETPLYRRVISGTAIEQGSEYGARDMMNGPAAVPGDETEDLFELLKLVKVRLPLCARGSHAYCHKQAEHPEVQGVAVGAILSNYQRVRVEHV